MEVRSAEMRVNLIEEGRWDEMQLKQPKFALDSKEGNIIQVTFKYSEDLNEKETMERCTSTVK